MKSDATKILKMLHGYRDSCLLVAAVQVGVFAALAQGSLPLSELARKLSLDGDALDRFLKALSAVGLVAVGENGWGLTSSGRLFVTPGMGDSLCAWARLIGGEYLPTWGRLEHSLRTGEPAFEEVFGMKAWEHRRHQAELGEAFQKVGTAPHRRVLAGLTQVYDFSRVKRVVDVGGGSGALVRGLMDRYSGLEGVLFDLPEVVAREEQLEVVGGSFFDEIPPGADVYLLKHVLHNWNDEECRRLLHNCHAAMGDDGVLLVLEDPLDQELERLMLDLHMLLIQGGRERTLAEYRELLDDVGLCLATHHSTRRGCPDVLEVRPS